MLFFVQHVWYFTVVLFFLYVIQVSQVYQTMTIDNLSRMIPFFDFPIVEKISVDAVKNHFLAMKVDYRNGAILFGNKVAILFFYLLNLPAKIQPLIQCMIINLVTVASFLCSITLSLCMWKWNLIPLSDFRSYPVSWNSKFYLLLCQSANFLFFATFFLFSSSTASGTINLEVKVFSNSVGGNSLWIPANIYEVQKSYLILRHRHGCYIYPIFTFWGIIFLFEAGLAFEVLLLSNFFFS